jgi:hypothetical protein
MAPSPDFQKMPRAQQYRPGASDGLVFFSSCRNVYRLRMKDTSNLPRDGAVHTPAASDDHAAWTRGGKDGADGRGVWAAHRQANSDRFGSTLVATKALIHIFGISAER